LTRKFIHSILHTQLFTPFSLRKGAISCSHKHFLCLKDIVEKKHDYGIIIEDNMCFTDDFPQKSQTYVDQLYSVYGNWDILFNHFNDEWGKHDYSKVEPGLFVYPKSNEINHRCDGGTKSANCYLLTYECAKKLYENSIPFNNPPDAHYNILFRKSGIKSFWVEPHYVQLEKNHVTTTQNLIK
jgi:GR25 family glycosyltransferase involved in LPS biosynthesis